MAELETQLEAANAAFQKFLDRLEAEFAGAKAGGDKVYQLREAEGLREVLREIGGGPVAKDLEQAKAETLMWSLDGALRYVPLAALYDGERYMVERYRDVVFTPATQANLKDQPRAQSKGIGLGVSKAHGDFNALPAVPDELHSIFRDTAASTTTTSASATATETPAVAPA